MVFALSNASILFGLSLFFQIISFVFPIFWFTQRQIRLMQKLEWKCNWSINWNYIRNHFRSNWTFDVVLLHTILKKSEFSTNNKTIVIYWWRLAAQQNPIQGTKNVNLKMHIKRRRNKNELVKEATHRSPQKVDKWEFDSLRLFLFVSFFHVALLCRFCYE